MAREAPNHLQTGRAAEDAALAYLGMNGLQLVERNYRTPLGEIDLVMKSTVDKTLVFVEVRYRRHQQFGSAAESVDRRKQKKLVAAAEHFLQHHKSYAQLPCRFDVVSFSGDVGNSSLQWYPNAFDR